MLVIAALEKAESLTVRISSPSLALNRHCRCSTRCEKTLRSAGSSTEFIEDINRKRLQAPETANFKRRRNRSILYQRLCTQGMMTSSNLREETPSPQMNLSFPERRFSFEPSNG
jgi:hypothetical protein